MTPFGWYHCFTDSENSFHKRLEVVLLSYPTRVATCEPHLWLVAVLNFWLNSSHTSSMGINFNDCTGQGISCSTCLSSSLIIYLWQSSLVWFGLLSCMRKILEQQSTFLMGLCDAAVCCDNRSDSIYYPPDANPHFCNWHYPSSHHSKASSIH